MHLSSIEIRRLSPAELSEYDLHLKRLDWSNRRSRFAATVDNDSISTHCLWLTAHSAVVIGALADCVLRGGAELVSIGKGSAEAAFSVEEEFQGKGIGRRLFDMALTEAGRLGFHDLQIDVLGGDPAMLHLVKSKGGRLIGLGETLSYRVAVGLRATTRTA